MRWSGPWVAVIRASADYFALVFGAGFLLGLVRVPYLVPRFGERTAELLEAPVMLVVLFFASRYIVRHFGLGSKARQAMAVGLVALVLLVLVELFLALALTGRCVTEYVYDRDPISGSVYLVLLLIYAVLPWLHARRCGPFHG